MTERKLTNRVRKLKELEAQQKELEKEIEELKNEIKEDMAAKGLEEQRAGDFIVRFTTVISNRFNTKAFQADHSKLYDRYIKPSESKRFSVVSA